MAAKRPYKLPTYPQDPRGPGSRHDWHSAFRDRLGEARERLSRKPQTPYEILGVSRDCDAQTAKAAYHKLALANHPDHHPGDAEKAERFKDAAAAYALVSDAIARGVRLG